jgi:plastocyanin
MRSFLACALLLVVGCGDDDTSQRTNVPPADLSAVTPPSADQGVVDLGGAAPADLAQAPSAPMTAAVQVGPNNQLAFAPQTVDIAAGGTVTWTWAATNQLMHDVTSASNPPAFTKSAIMSSGSFSHMFPTAGSFPYFCTVHGRTVMNGTVNVH